MAAEHRTHDSTQPLFGPGVFPEKMRSLRQYCIRCEKQPYIRDRMAPNSFTSNGWAQDRENWLTLDESLDAWRREVKVWHRGRMRPASGIGFLVAPNDSRILGGDLDCCRDPETGELSAWAREILQKVQPMYTEVSLSGTGIRFFVTGRLPGGRGNIFGNGPQDDLSQETKARILDRKPEVGDKIAKGEPAFNGLEIYATSRHLALTGKRIDELCFSDEDRTAALAEILAPFIADEITDEIAGEIRSESQQVFRRKLPPLNILDVIDTSGFEKVGEQLFGPHPTLGSTTGRNLVVNPSKNVYCWMHNGINAGGDAWTWLACECGAIAWEKAGPGVLNDPQVLRKTLEHAAKRGLVSAELIETRSNKKEQKETPREEYPPEIREKAMEILRHGDPIKYIVDACSRTVLGAEQAFRKLICCISVQNIRQSQGLHPKLSGESGSGKTFVVSTFAHYLPPETVVQGSTSNLAPFYHNDGDRLFRILDDYRAGNENLDQIIKQTSSVFHQRYKHRTVRKQRPLTLEIGSEQTWAITSVDTSQDIQVLNRQLPINVDDSVELTRQVNSRTIERYGKGEEAFSTDEVVQVCRAIWRILRDEGMINVRVPFWKHINWLDTSNRRNPSLFMDLLIAHTAMYRYQRERDEEGYYLATEEDFHAARALFIDTNAAEELVHRLTRKEREVAEILACHPDGLTREEIATRLKPTVSPRRVGQILHGEDGKSGLMQKLPVQEQKVADTIALGDTYRRTSYKTIYTLPGYDRLAGFDAIVRLEPADIDGSSGRFAEGSRKVSKEGIKSISEEEEEEGRKEGRKREREGQNAHTPKIFNGRMGKSSGSLYVAKNPSKPSVEPPDSDSRPSANLPRPSVESADIGSQTFRRPIGPSVDPSEEEGREDCSSVYQPTEPTGSVVSTTTDDTAEWRALLDQANVENGFPGWFDEEELDVSTQNELAALKRRFDANVAATEQHFHEAAERYTSTPSDTPFAATSASSSKPPGRQEEEQRAGGKTANPGCEPSDKSVEEPVLRFAREFITFYPDKREHVLFKRAVDYLYNRYEKFCSALGMPPASVEVFVHILSELNGEPPRKHDFRGFDRFFFGLRFSDTAFDRFIDSIKRESNEAKPADREQNASKEGGA